MAKKIKLKSKRKRKRRGYVNEGYRHARDYDRGKKVTYKGLTYHGEPIWEPCLDIFYNMYSVKVVSSLTLTKKRIVEVLMLATRINRNAWVKNVWIFSAFLFDILGNQKTTDYVKKYHIMRFVSQSPKHRFKPGRSLIDDLTIPQFIDEADHDQLKMFYKFIDIHFLNKSDSMYRNEEDLDIVTCAKRFINIEMTILAHYISKAYDYEWYDTINKMKYNGTQVNLYRAFDYYDIP